MAKIEKLREIGNLGNLTIKKPVKSIKIGNKNQPWGKSCVPRYQIETNIKNSWRNFMAHNYFKVRLESLETPRGAKVFQSNPEKRTQHFRRNQPPKKVSRMLSEISIFKK